MGTRRYAIVIEGGGTGGNYSAYVPDLPGCIASGQSLDELRRNMAQAISLHLHGMYADGDALPDGASQVEYVEVPDDPVLWAQDVEHFPDPAPPRRAR